MKRFVGKRGEPALVEALEAWVHRTPDLEARVKTIDFNDAHAFEDRLTRLQRRHSAGPGLRTLEHALYCMGILSERFHPPDEQHDARTAVSAMLEVLWPMTREEQRLRADLAGLIGADLARATWELCALRIWTVKYLLAIHFRDDEAVGQALVDRLNQLFRSRVPRDEPVPPNYEDFMLHRSREYFKIVHSDGPKSAMMTTPIVAGAFAWYCRRTHDLQVRLIGAREFTIAMRRLNGMIAAYRGRDLD